MAMNPIELSDSLIRSLQSYLTTSFNVDRDGTEAALAKEIRKSFKKPEALARGPYLEITPPFTTGCSLNDLIDEGVLSSKFLSLPPERRPLPINASLYSHQEKAIRKLVSDEHNIVVSSGTGSGKTECFLIPILDDLLKDETPGVRAVLIYPLNALVNDQLERLRKLLEGTDIKFGRYTGELKHRTQDALKEFKDEPLPNEIISREQIHDGGEIPQILITNYAMLEYLLLRPEDSVLFESESWRYIVLDEAHTYSGAQGIEVGMLMRRLKHRLGKNPGDITCIATSATLTNDDAKAATTFAESLFGEPFERSDIIFGDPDHDYARSQNPSLPLDPHKYLHVEFDELIKNVHHGEQSTKLIATQMDSIGLIPPSLNWHELATEFKDNPRGFVYEIMRDNHDLIQLREQLLEHDVVELSKFANEFFSGRLQKPSQCQQAFYRLVELGAAVRLEEDATALLPARYHMFMRSPQGIWLCLNPDCNDRQSPPDDKWSKVFSTNRETCDACGCKVYHMTVCRECGQIYLQTINTNDRYENFHGTPNELTPKDQIRYFVWKELESQYAFGSEQELETEDNDTQGPDGHNTLDIQICLRCGCGTRDRASLRCACIEKDTPIHIQLKMLQDVKAKRNGDLEISPCNFINSCPRCGDSAQKDTEIATPVHVRGSGPLSIITYDFYRGLPASPQADVRAKPGQGRKVLTFTDSRQGAARFAPYFAHSVALDNYRYIVPKAINDFIQRKNYKPDVDQIVPEVRNLVWSLGIPHNDPDSGFFRFGRVGNRMRRRDEDKLDIVVGQHLLGDITTGRLRRQSLESLGLVAIHYFDDEEPDFLPDFEVLAGQLGLNSVQTRTLVEYLLDDLRKRKLLTLPRDVDPLNRSFGTNPGYPTLVRGNPQKFRHQLPWHGTERHPRNKYIRLVLHTHGLSHDESATKRALNSIFEWLIDSNILIEIYTGAYRVDHNKLVFDTRSRWYQCAKCQRLHAHGADLPCPHEDCGDSLETINDINTFQNDNYFYQSFARTVVPIRIEEHTAQLRSDRGREYQDGFKQGDINVLSCSTTFELGIDLGDLQAIVMSNVPPTVANYRQRSGRAGRRAGGAAFILTWTSDRPHDQSYYRNPQDIIAGDVRIPNIHIDNQLIQRRHINAILLSEFLRYRKTKMGHDWQKRQDAGLFFDKAYAEDPHIDHLKSWLVDEHTHIWEWLSRFGCTNPDSNIEDFREDITRIGNNYFWLANYYQQRYDTAQQHLHEDHDRYIRDLNDFPKFQKRLRKERLERYLSNRGVLPSYSFPIHSVELYLPPDKDEKEELQLQRDLKVAIREFAPGSDVVADKRIWRSGRVWFQHGAPRVYEYRICDVCNGLQMSREAGVALPPQSAVCSECKHRSRVRPFKYIEPDGFFADRKESGKLMRQYVAMMPNVMKSALIPSAEIVLEETPAGYSYGYDRNGWLLYVNEGDPRFARNHKLGGFHIELDGDKRGSLIPRSRRTNNTRLSLGHRRATDTLHLQFACEQQPDNRSFWLSLMYALIHGACRTLQIERKDIDGVLFPRRLDDRGGWQQTIVLYDDVPGGAGHVEEIREEFGTVVLAALNIAKCEDCAPDTSCYSCLRDYNNQLYHHLLRRDEITKYLTQLHHNMACRKI